MNTEDIIRQLPERGHFATSLMQAWYRADSGNRLRIESAFRHILKRIDSNFEPNYAVSEDQVWTFIRDKVHNGQIDIDGLINMVVDAGFTNPVDFAEEMRERIFDEEES